MLKLRRLILGLIFAASLLFTLAISGCFTQNQPLIIGIAAGFSDDSNQGATQALRGVQEYVDQINQQGGINGKTIKIETFDDQNDAEQGVIVAREIAENSQALVVIGHEYSSVSIPAGRIYKEYGVPAISGSATAEAVTIGNEWYFRSVFNNTAQAKFLSQYANKALGQSTAVLIYDRQEPYSLSLGEAFQLGFREFGGRITQTYAIDAANENFGRDVRAIANEIKTLPPNDVGLIALLTNDTTASEFIRAFRREEIAYPIAGGDTLSNGSFIQSFNVYADEQRRPGYYTDGIYSVSPIMYDVLGEEGANFRQRYIERYGEEPSWLAGTYYDAAKVVVAALSKANVSGDSARLKEERQRVRDAIASINNPDEALQGISGPLYFDARGDVNQVPAIGIMQSGQLIPAFNQLTPVTVPKSQNELRQSIESGEIVQFGSQVFNQTDVIYTGLRPRKINELNLDEKTFALDFDLWFRYRSDLDESEIKNIRFLNAVEDLYLDEPVLKTEEEGVTYSLYKVSGVFHADVLASDRRFNEHILSVSFINDLLSRSQLVYVTDSIGLELTQGRSLAQRVRSDQILSPDLGWRINQYKFFQTITQKEPLGRPVTLETVGEEAEFSQFNLAMIISPDAVTLRRITGGDGAVYLLAVGVLMGTALVVQRFYQRMVWSDKAKWLITAIAVLLILFASEILIINSLEPRLDVQYVEIVVTGFDTLWWIVPAYLLGEALEYFFWKPLEKKTGLAIPTLVHRMVLFVIYLLTLFCVIAFVFNRPLSSLLATSGLALTIIGLAIQINISNVFAGLAINLEKTFKVGDYIEIPSKNLTGYVIDINWRATRIRTRSGNVIVVPNSDINNETIINYMLPDELSRATLVFQLDSEVPTDLAIAVLTDAVKSIAGKGDRYPLEKPEPYVMVGPVGLIGIDYWVRCWHIPKNSSVDDIRDTVTQTVLKALQEAGIKLAKYEGFTIDGSNVSNALQFET